MCCLSECGQRMKWLTVKCYNPICKDYGSPLKQRHETVTSDYLSFILPSICNIVSLPLLGLLHFCRSWLINNMLNIYNVFIYKIEWSSAGFECGKSRVQSPVKDRILDSLVVECWLRVREVPGLIPSQGPRHTKDVIKWYR